MEKLPACFGEPLCYHNRAENECWNCPFEKRCDAARKENALCKKQ